MIPAGTWASILVGNSERHMEDSPQSDPSQCAGLSTPTRRCCSRRKQACPGLSQIQHRKSSGLGSPSVPTWMVGHTLSQPVTHWAEQAPGHRPKCWQFGDTAR